MPAVIKSNRRGKLVGLSEAAADLDLNRATVSKLARAGKLPTPHYFGRSPKWPRPVWQSFLRGEWRPVPAEAASAET